MLVERHLVDDGEDFPPQYVYGPTEIESVIWRHGNVYPPLVDGGWGEGRWALVVSYEVRGRSR